MLPGMAQHPRIRARAPSHLSPGIDRPAEKRPPPAFVIFEDAEAGFRLVKVGPDEAGRFATVLEVPDGRDATGRTRWQRARIVPQGQPDTLLEGWKDISSALGVSKLDTVLGYARRPVDPLPVRVNAQGKVWIFLGVLRAWAAANTMSWRQRRLWAEVDQKRPKRKGARSSRA